MIRTVLRFVLALFYAIAGYFHLAAPDGFLTITPVWVTMPDMVVFWTGIAELFGAAALAQPFSPRLRQAGGIGLSLYALCVFPANINHMIMYLDGQIDAPSMVYHAPRMVAQPVLIWLALWTGGVTDWPFRRRSA